MAQGRSRLALVVTVVVSAALGTPGTPGNTGSSSLAVTGSAGVTEKALIAYAKGAAPLTLESARVGPGSSVVDDGAMRPCQPALRWQTSAKGRTWTFARPVVFAQSTANEEVYDFQQSVTALA